MAIATEAQYGGSSGYKFRLRLVTTLLYQETGNNRSRMRVQAYIKSVVSTTIWNSDSTYANIRPNGVLVNTSVNGYGASGSSHNNQSWGFASNNYEFWVNHNADGNKTFNSYAYHNATNSPYLLEAATSHNYTLPRIPKKPIVSTTTIASITPTSATFAGNISDGGGATVTDAGVFYSTTDSTPDSNDSDADSGGDHSGSFSKNQTGLTPNTFYYYRAYAVNSQGTGYGAVKSFTTYELPEVTTNAVTNIAGTTVTANGNLNNNGQPNLTEKGFVYGTAPDPTTANTKVQVAGTTVGAYSANLTGLTPSTTYYIRAYAKNTADTVYGASQVFQTVVVPTLTTDDPSGITTTTVDMAGEVLSDGGGTVSERGFVYDTATAPTTADSKLQVGSGTGVFSDTIISLTPSILHYVRSYAINEGGTAYGEEKTFTTVETNPLQPDNLSPTGGEATDDLTPDLTWDYNPGSANDTQKDYQVIVTRQSDSFQMWDSGKITSAVSLATYAGTALAYDIDYQWEVRTYNQADLVSPYSATALFKTSELPVVAITYPTDTATIPSNTPTITWTYSDAESTAQVSYRVKVYESDSVTVIHDTGKTLGTNLSYQIPAGILETANTYHVSVELEDGDGMFSTLVTHEFTVVFLAPAQPTIATTVDGAGIVDINVTINQPPTDGWYADQIILYKKLDGGLEYSKLLENLMVNYVVIDDAEDEALWTESGVGTNPISDTAKYGTQSVGYGVTGVGANDFIKTIDLQNVLDYDVFQAMVYVGDSTQFTSLSFRLETDASNYFQIQVTGGELADNVWNPVYKGTDLWTVVGVPDTADINSIRILVDTPTGAITAGDISVDQIRLLQSLYTFQDYDTANGTDLLYGISVYSSEAEVSTGIVESQVTEIRFIEERYNSYIVPVGQEEKMVRLWIDGSTAIPINDKTETRYYEPIGAKTPSVFVNGNQQYKEGSVQGWFFDEKLGGMGLGGVEVLESIKNVKPVILRGWWGRNYFISIDGNLSTNRKPGVGWATQFTFKEIDDGK